MKYPDKIYKSVKSYYESLSNERKIKIGERTKKITAEIPEIAEIDSQISVMAINFAKSVKSNDDAQKSVELFRKECEEINKLRKKLLTDNGYPENYLDETFICEICNDTGYVDGRICKCFEEKIVEEIKKESNLPLIMDSQNFDTFNINYYSDEGSPSPREVMTAVRDMCKSYSEEFSGSSPNLLFYGGTGLGKTFLSSCIAKKVMDKGHSVFYQSAYKIFSMFDKVKFDDDKDEMVKFHTENAYDVDLLVIDDLGTEFITTYTAEVLFDLINTRLNSGKKSIINTNLGPEELEKIYSSRITSRLFGEYIPIEFYGKDIRMLKQTENF